MDGEKLRQYSVLALMPHNKKTALCEPLFFVILLQLKQQRAWRER